MGNTEKTGAANLNLPAHLQAVRLLGAGTIASVFLAKDLKLKRLVAVKLLRPEIASDEKACRRFEREAQSAARLTSNNVPAVYSVGRLEDQGPYIEMQYIEGKNLADVLVSGEQLNVERARGMLRQIASALAVAHSQNIIHRDVKPANVLIDNDDHVWLTDFGVAAIVESGSEAVTKLTREGERFGDPSYMSPEQVRGEALTEQSDVYSFGIVAFEIIAGNGPFDSPEIRDISSAHIRRPPPKLADRRSDVPVWLSNLLHRCMAKTPNHRPTSKEVFAALETGMDTEVIADSEKDNLQHFFKELKKRRVYQAAATYAAAVFIILQVADLMLPAFVESQSIYKGLVLVLLFGFPIAMMLSWVYDWRSGRLVRTPDDISTDGQVESGRHKLALKIAGLGLCVITSAGIAIWLLRS